MVLRKTTSLAFLAAFVLGGCSVFSDINNALFPSSDDADAGLSAPSPQATPQATTNTAQGAVPLPPPPAVSQSQMGALPSTGASGAAPGQPSGTFVGQKVSALRNDMAQLRGRVGTQSGQLQQLRGQIVQDSETYHGTIAAIQARLQVGTTPGNPVLVQQWNEAQNELERINGDVLRMNQLSTDVAASSTMASFLLNSVRDARTLSGGVDEDFRQLSGLEDETNTLSVSIERLLGDLATDTQRQQAYVSNERGNLNLLAVSIRSGQMYSGSLAVTPVSSMGPVGLSGASSLSGAGDRPLVVIRFDRPNVPYESALYTAVKAALDRRPTASFEVVSVAPSGAVESQVRRQAQSVVRSMTQMGLPPDRVHLSATSSQSVSKGEVQVYVR